MSACRSCKEEILWAETKTGKPIPLDATPVRYARGARGLFGLVIGSKGDPIALPVSDLPEEIHYEIAAWRSHFATCPHADSHRQSRSRS